MQLGVLAKDFVKNETIEEFLDISFGKRRDKNVVVECGECFTELEEVFKTTADGFSGPIARRFKRVVPICGGFGRRNLGSAIDGGNSDFQITIVRINGLRLFL